MDERAMDERTLRTLGLAVGCGALAIAATIAAMSGPAPPSPAPRAAPAADTAHAAFIVRFKSDHPLGKAQALAAQGKAGAAKAAAERALNAPDLKGLCFERFTLGGAETVLRPCGGGPRSTPEAWLARLRAMPGVDYADANVTLDAEKAHVD
jgi:hypothetical protein